MALVDAGRVVRIWRWTLEGLRAGARAYDGAGPMTGARASPGASAGVGIGEAGAVRGGSVAVNRAPTCGRARHSLLPCRILDSHSQMRTTILMWFGRSHL